jgi:cysteine-rich repeat protein
MRQRLLTSLLLATSLPVWAAEIVPVGPEFRVSRVGDTYTNDGDGASLDATVEPLSDGGFVVAWESYVYNYGYYSYTYGPAVRARRFTDDAHGGVEKTVFFQASTTGQGYFRPDGATTPSDRFVVVWGNFEANPPGDPTESGRVWMRRYDQALNPLSSRTQVTGSGAYTNAQTRFAVAPDADDGFLVVWEDYVLAYPGNAMMGRKFDADGTATTAAFQINTTALDSNGYIGADSDAAGNVVVVWTDFTPPGSMRGQRVDSTGALVGSEFEIFDSDNDEIKNEVAVSSDGHFLAIGYPPVTARIFAPDATPLTSEFVVSAGQYFYGGAAADPDNFFVIGSQPQFGNVRVQRFALDGTPDGAAMIANQALEVDNHALNNPSIAVDDAGDFVVVWSNAYFNYPYGSQEGPTEGPGVWGRQFAVCGNSRIGRTQSCDDGDATGLDGCSAKCQTETCHLCAGEPSSCSSIAGCTTLCSDAGQILNGQLTLKKVGAPLGDESLSLRGKITDVAVAPGAYDPSIEGAEVVLHGTDVLYQLTAPLPIPPGLVGSACDLLDGWKVKGTAPNRTFTYKNVSGALPPACTAGSANGLKNVKFKDRLAIDGTMQVKVKVKNGAIATAPPPPLTATVVLGQSPAAGAAGRCGRVRFTSQIGTRYFPELL